VRSPRPETWRRAEILFEASLDRPAAEREEFLSRACGPDEELRSTVESLLTQEERLGDFLERGLPSPAPDASLAAPPGAEWRGRRLGPYELLDPIGQGGMSAVFLAERRDGELVQQVAIKILPEGAHPAALRLFRRERQILARLEHPNIARFLAGGSTEEGVPYVVMEYVEGLAITDYCDSRRLGARERIGLFRKVCAAVQYAHRNLVVHRDLKPGNILVTDDGEPKLLDFGIAKLLDLPRGLGGGDPTITQERFLTPNYASPEQLAGEPVSTASDLYSLGVLLHQLLTGLLPHGGRRSELSTPGRDPEPEMALPSAGVWSRQSSLATSGEMHLRAERAAARGTTPSRLHRDLRGDLDNIILGCLARDPADRYGSVEQLSADLNRYLVGLPILARPAHLGYRVRKFLRRHAVASAATLVATLAVMILLPVIWLHSERLARERDLSRQAQKEAEEVTLFLTDAFRLADPYQAADVEAGAGGEVTVREVLDYSSERVRREFQDRPLLRARLMSILAGVYSNLGQVDPAISLYREVLAIRRQELGAQHKELIEGQLGFAFVLLHAGKTAEAETLIEQILGSSDQPAGAEGLRLAEALTMLGMLRTQQGQWREGIAPFEEALAILDRLKRPKPRLRAVVSIQLGVALQRSGELERAEEHLRHALEVLHRIAGEEHPDIASALMVLGRIRADQTDLEAAEELLRQALNMREKLQGPEHPETLTCRSYLGQVLFEKGSFEEAEEMFREVLELDRRILGAEHPDIASDLNSLALASWERGRLEVADSLLEQAVGISRDHWGEENPRTARYLSNRGALLHDLGQEQAAETMLREALVTQAKLLGPEDRDVGATQMHLADLLLKTGRLEEGEAMAREAVRVLSEALSPGHRRTAVARTVLADALARQGHFEEAEALVRASLPILAAGHKKSSRTWQLASRRAHHLYEAWGRPAPPE